MKNKALIQSSVLLSLPLLALVTGLLLWQTGLPACAHLAWQVATLPALASLLHSLFTAFVRQQLGVDVLALLAILAALIMGEPLTGAVIAVMYASGHALERYAEARAGQEMNALLARAPHHAHRLENSMLVTVNIKDIASGDRLLVKPGEIVPVDGSLLSEQASLDESSLSGESLTVAHHHGSLLQSGVLNAGAPFEMLAAASAANSTFAGIVRLVEQAQHSRAPATRLADRYALWFVPFSLLLAAGSAYLSQDPIRALAVLVVATPCPLLLAVPVAIVAGMSSCARRGILVKNGTMLERLAQADVLFLDKTGTLTGGQAHLLKINSIAGVPQSEVLRLAASLAQVSCHAIAGAVVAAARSRSLVLAIPEAVHEEAGAGMSGQLDGKRIVIGSHDYVCRHADNADWAQQHLAHIAFEGSAAVYVALERQIIGMLEMADQIRTETPRALRLLHQAGITRIAMLTGDHRDVAESIAASIGVDEVFAQMSPAGKLAAIEDARKQSVTIMIGDGINDAPALAAADIGVAMGARGAAAAAESAGVVLLVDRLDRLAEALHIARQTRQIALQSVFAGMGLSMAAMIMAAMGMLSPIAGAILQELIDVAVIINALRALRIHPLRVSRHTLPAARLQQLRDEHDRITPVLDQLGFVAEQLSVLDGTDALAALNQLEQVLSEQLLAHEQADERTVYPDLARLLGGDDPLAMMSRTHREIFHLSHHLKHLILALPEGGASQASRNEIQRLLFGLEAILRLHFAQEEELFHTLS